jgi:hypothetical protein
LHERDLFSHGLLNIRTNEKVNYPVP